jgi:hypothetical protein
MDGQDTQVRRSDGLEAQIAVKSPMGGIIYNFRYHTKSQDKVASHTCQHVMHSVKFFTLDSGKIYATCKNKLEPAKFMQPAKINGGNNSEIHSWKEGHLGHVFYIYQRFTIWKIHI